MNKEHQQNEYLQEELFKSESPSSPLSMQFPSQETIAERVKLKPRESKKTGTGFKILTPNKLLTRLPIL